MPRQPRFAQPVWARGRTFLSHLASSLTRALPQPGDAPSMRGRRSLLRKISRSLPEMTLDAAGVHLESAKDSQLLTLAPGALQRLERRIDVLHMMGVRHNDIRPGNVVIDRYGELHLVNWRLAHHGGSTDKDISGLHSVRQFLRERLGV